MILIITNTQDVTADFVVRELTRRGLPFARLNTDEFPVYASGWARFEPNRPPLAVLDWSNRERELDWSSVKAVWYRRPTTPGVAQDITDPGVRKFAEDESYEFLRGLWYSLDCFWISHPESIRRSDHKIVQLHEAFRCGFLFPRTIVTNSAEQVRALQQTCSDGIVVKPLYVGFLKHGECDKHIYTTLLSAADLQDSEAISLAPAIYQQYIPKSADLRVTVVGDQVFAVRIIAKGLPIETPDWRRSDPADLEHELYQLPREEEQRCIQLVKHLGLEFGAIDYVLDREQRHVFLEINANGQWAWLEAAVGIDISGAIVDHLLAGQR